MNARAARRGQGLVEFALFVTLLFTLLGGVVDLGTLLSDHLAIVYVARQAALVTASAGANTLADCDALAAIAAGTAGLTGVRIRQIVIYQSANDGLPIGGAGNTTYADVYNGDPGCSGSAPVPSIGNWLPATRNANLFSGNALGVEIDYTYSWQTLLINVGALNISDHTVMPLGPG